MTAQEMQYHFELKINQFNTLDKYFTSTDIAIFLNLAQDQLVNDRYSNKYGDVSSYFESDEKNRLELGSLIKNSVKIDNQIKNYRMLQTKALESYDVAKKLNDQARKKMEGVSDTLIKEQFFDEFFNLGEDLLNGAKTSMNNVWIKAHEDKLKKLCRRM